MQDSSTSSLHLVVYVSWFPKTNTQYSTARRQEQRDLVQAECTLKQFAPKAKHQITSIPALVLMNLVHVHPSFPTCPGPNLLGLSKQTGRVYALKTV